MASLIARRAFTTTARRLASGEEALKSETKKNPEIAVRHIQTHHRPYEPPPGGPAEPLRAKYKTPRRPG